ncbi:hypothetical protein NQZ68_032157 [Xyrichtys novacula]|uniref:Uncharacterized protein n=1 Tax=Xyrichtys novacula TaxID=13765 RepID=A0AAV1FR41_XYRNO|nr:hypothetical protein NQZ68_032157 [Xyrichtys novacula]
MEALRNLPAVSSGPGKTSVTSGPLFSDGTDSVLTAARLARRGWTEDGRKTGWQFSHVYTSPRQPPVSRPDGNQVQIHIQVSPKDPRSGPGPVFNNKTTSEDRETCSEKRAEEDKQTRGGGGALQVNRPSLKSALTEKQKVVRSQPGVVFVWASGCRTKSKPSRRFKPPMLPVIAEL